MKFSKMHGLGNDYIYLNNLNNQITNPEKLSIKLSNRHFGIGSDGLILICSSDKADFKMRMFNSDGTEAEMCGNGIRCVGKYVYDKGLTKKEKLSIETKAGIKYLDLFIKNNKVVKVTVDMGEPIFKEDLIPVTNFDEKITLADIEYGKVTTKIDEKNFSLTCVSMGNPHAITYVSNLDNFDVEMYGKALENDGHFPKKTNVEFIEIVDRKTIKMRVWERGSGETLACGTGACASVVASILNGLTERKVKVLLLGGTLDIEWKKDNHVYMTGEATTVFEGEINE